MKTQIRLSMVMLGLTASAACLAGDFEDYARVISVSPQIEQINRPRQQCWVEQAQVQQPRSQRSAGGAIIGGLAGGLLGSQIGGGNGRLAATAVGAVTGAMVGDRLENDNGAVASEQPVRHCRTVDQWESRTSGYAVTYEYGGRTYTSVLPYDPGNRIPVRVSIVPKI